MNTRPLFLKGQKAKVLWTAGGFVFVGLCTVFCMSVILAPPAIVYKASGVEYPSIRLWYSIKGNEQNK